MDITWQVARDAAIEYARQGFYVFPFAGIVPLLNVCTCPNRAECENPGKHPWCKNGVYSATRDIKQIKRWNRKWKAGANVGIHPGPSRMLVVDVDTADGKQGERSLAQLEEQYGPFPRDWTVRTGSGGLHIYLRLPAGVYVGSPSGWRQDIDLRSTGIGVVAPPSLHVSGGTYNWESRIGDDPPLPPAAWLPILPLVEEPDKPALDEGHKPERDTSEENTERDRKDRLVCISVSSVAGWSEDCQRNILDSIEFCVITEPDTHNGKRMSLARRLKAHPELQGLDGEQLEWAYRQWFDRSLPHVAENHRDWATSFSQWIKVWDWTKIDITKESPNMAYQKSLKLPLPKCADRYKSKNKRQLLALCRVLQTDYPEEPWGAFYLSVRKAAEVLGDVTKDVISAWMNDFVSDNLLQKICHICGGVNTIEAKYVDGVCRRKCTACETDFTGSTKAQRYRYVGDTLAAGQLETTAA